MTRRGKIARLPRQVWDELNRRLDDSEPGVRLIEWLNGLPEVKEMLEREFEGRPISDANLSEWTNGGFRDWQSQQETLDLSRQMTEEGPDFDEVSANVAKSVESVTLTHYAAALQRSNIDTTEKPDKRLRRLSGSLKDVDRLRAREQARERLELDRRWFELAERKAEAARRGKPGEPPVESNEEATLTHQEKAEILKELIFRDLNGPPKL